MHTMGTETIAPPPPGRARLIISLLIVTYLLLQLAVPTSYYLGNNPSDERFSWRMFSDLWHFHKTCIASIVETVAVSGADDTPSLREVDLQRTLHPTWVKRLAWDWRLVVEKFLRTRCESDPSVTEVQFIQRCSAAAESRIPSVNLRLTCRTGTFTGSPGMP